MIIVQFPPTVNGNYEGNTFIEPSYYIDMYIDEEFKGEDTLSKILNSTVKIFRENKYPNLYNFSLELIDEEYKLIKFHYQIPKYSTEQDSMEYNEKPISFWGIARYDEVDVELSDFVQ